MASIRNSNSIPRFLMGLDLPIYQPHMMAQSLTFSFTFFKMANLSIANGIESYSKLYNLVLYFYSTLA